MGTKWLFAASLLGALAGGWSAVAAADSAPAVTRSVLQKHDLRASGFEGVMARVEIPVGGREGRHTHPAEAFVYVLEGTLTLNVEGHDPAILKAGDSFFIEPGKVHEGINTGATAVRVVAVFTTEKGKPLTTPAR
jgi:quercetin dioxygenase-like cupin family protein